PLMGAVAARLSDLVIITSDNPRSEDPEQIIEEVKRGIVMPANRTPPKGQPAPKSTPFVAIVDRREAIARAVRDARAEDLVLIAGKGHEKYQQIGDRTLPFGDVEVARGALGVLAECAAAKASVGSTDAADVVIGVPDTTVALQQIARDVRRRSGARLVAITGSAGKTTTKEIVAEFLAARYRVFRNKG